jgi:two-component system, chemotaxis family, chemotaxis protein CheY
MAKRVVIVDDSATLARQLKTFLEDEMDCEVVATGSDGVQALELYRVHRPDLITLDITMPRKDGQAALEDILEEFPDAKVMMISAIRGSEMAKCLMAGAKAYVEKPLLFGDARYVADFRANLREVFAGK